MKLYYCFLRNWVFWFSISIYAAASSRPVTNQPTPPPTNADSTTEQQQQYMNKRLVVALIVVSSALVSIVSSFLCFYIYRLKTHSKLKHQNPSGNLISVYLFLIYFNERNGCSYLMYLIEDGTRGGGGGVSILLFSKFHSSGSGSAVSMIEYPLLEAATNNFEDNNVVGQGGFGCVYKACFDNNIVAAVKRMNTGGQGQGHSAETEFQVLTHFPVDVPLVCLS